MRFIPSPDRLLRSRSLCSWRGKWTCVFAIQRTEWIPDSFSTFYYPHKKWLHLQFFMVYLLWNWFVFLIPHRLDISSISRVFVHTRPGTRVTAFCQHPTMIALWCSSTCAEADGDPGGTSRLIQTGSTKRFPLLGRTFCLNWFKLTRWMVGWLKRTALMNRPLRGLKSGSRFEGKF